MCAWHARAVSGSHIHTAYLAQKPPGELNIFIRRALMHLTHTPCLYANAPTKNELACITAEYHALTYTCLHIQAALRRVLGIAHIATPAFALSYTTVSCTQMLASVMLLEMSHSHLRDLSCAPCPSSSYFRSSVNPSLIDGTKAVLQASPPLAWQQEIHPHPPAYLNQHFNGEATHMQSCDFIFLLLPNLLYCCLIAQL